MEMESILLERGIDRENLKFIVHKNMDHKESYFVDRIYDGIKNIYLNIKRG